MLQTILALVSPVVAIGIAVWSFRRSNRSDRLRMLFDVQERYLNERVRHGRRLIHSIVAGSTVNELQHRSNEELSAIGYALAVMNTVAICCETGQVEPELLGRTMGRSYASTVAAARPYIDYVESIRGFRPYPYAERLATRWRAKVVGSDLGNSMGA